MKAEKELINEAAGAQDVPTSYVDIKTIAVEAEIPCRTASNLAFIGANGIFTSVTKSVFSVVILGKTVEVIGFNLALNPKHRIKPGAPVPNCNNDGVTFLPAQSVNVATVAEPQFTRNSSNVVTNVRVFFTRTIKSKPATLGLRVKFEENVSTPTQFNPKRKSGTISFP